MRQKTSSDALHSHASLRDYDTLSNSELQELLDKRLSTVAFITVSDENRATIIAMLKISEER